MVSTIAASAAEQSRGLSEINIGVSQLDQVTQQNAAMAEDAGNTTQQLNRQADALASLVARFRMEESTATDMPLAGSDDDWTQEAGPVSGGQSFAA